MSNFALSRNQRVYLQKETTFGTIPNSSGSATVTGSNACRIISASFTPAVGMLKRPDKTGTRTKTAGVAGRRNGTWSMSMSLAPNGAAGVVPDCDPIMCALMGKDATISAGVSATYSLADAIKSFSAFDFRTPSTVNQQIAAGCVVNEATFELGQDVATISLSGQCKNVLRSYTFSSLDSVGKCGLTSFPAEPGSPVTSGGIVAGFTGSIVLHSNTLANIRRATVKVATGNDTVKDTFGTYYPDTTEGDERSVSLAFELYDDDAAATQDLYSVAESKTAIDAVLTIGTVAGSILEIDLKGLQLAIPALNDGQRRWVCSFSESEATGSSITALDEIKFVWK